MFDTLETMFRNRETNGTPLFMFEDRKGRTIIGKLEIKVGEESFGIVEGSLLLHDPCQIARRKIDETRMAITPVKWPLPTKLLEVNPEEISFIYVDGISKELADAYNQVVTGIDLTSKMPPSSPIRV